MDLLEICLRLASVPNLGAIGNGAVIFVLLSANVCRKTVEHDHHREDVFLGGMGYSMVALCLFVFAGAPCR